MSHSDLIIIGSGVAAAAIADRTLRRDPKASILILEAGPRVKLKDYALWQHYLVTGQLPYDPFKDQDYADRDHPGENRSVGGTTIPLAGARVMTMGGSTIHWGGWSFRLKPEDFHLHTATQDPDLIDWPFDYETLEPYYGDAEHYIGVSGDSANSSVPRSQPYPFAAFPFTLEDKPLVTALRGAGVGYEHLPIARHGVSDTVSRHAPCQTTGTCKYCPFGARYAATNYLNDLLNWEDVPNLSVRTETVVEEIILETKQKVRGVLLRDRRTGHSEEVSAGRIVVAAGTIESAKLLLRSGGGWWQNGVGNDHDLVGRHFITHPYFIFTASLPGNTERLQTEMDFPTLCSRHFDSPAEQAAGKFILVNPPQVPSSLSLARLMQNGVQGEELEAAIRGPAQIQVHGMLEVFSRPRNRVQGLDQPNHLGLPQTLIDYTQDSGFDARMAQIQDHVSRILHQIDATLTGKPSVSWRADHAACALRMSRDDGQGVVDPDLRVHGTDNLFVCSNAVFASTGAVNPTLTLTALALRLADHLQGVSRTDPVCGARS